MTMQSSVPSSIKSVSKYNMKAQSAQKLCHHLPKHLMPNLSMVQMLKQTHASGQAKISVTLPSTCSTSRSNKKYLNHPSTKPQLTLCFTSEILAYFNKIFKNTFKPCHLKTHQTTATNLQHMVVQQPTCSA